MRFINMYGVEYPEESETTRKQNLLEFELPLSYFPTSENPLPGDEIRGNPYINAQFDGSGFIIGKNDAQKMHDRCQKEYEGNEYWPSQTMKFEGQGYSNGGIGVGQYSNVSFTPDGLIDVGNPRPIMRQGLYYAPASHMGSSYWEKIINTTHKVEAERKIVAKRFQAEKNPKIKQLLFNSLRQYNLAYRFLNDGIDQQINAKKKIDTGLKHYRQGKSIIKSIQMKGFGQVNSDLIIQRLKVLFPWE